MTQLTTAKCNNSQPNVLQQLVLTLAVVILSPVWLANLIFSILLNRSTFDVSLNKTVTGESIILRRFRCGFLRSSFLVWEVLNANVKLFGTPLNSGLELNSMNRFAPGLISLWQLRKLTGLSECDLETCIKLHQQFSAAQNIKLMIKLAIANVLYKKTNLERPEQFELFGININNITMENAIDSIIEATKNAQTQASAKIGYFVNVNSFNIAMGNARLKHMINSADWVFADGSGVRLAAKYKGIALQDNVNGTDMLPLLCQAAVKANKSIYLMGAQADVARTAANNLQKQFPGLRIAGTQHGYFKAEQTDQVINRINSSNADILLVGMGSPVQEQWLHHNADKLNCSAALAVGGLFDFFSGRIPRAPIWMRELGMEWIWRLLQEPKAKFHRYVIGNPLFLYRLATTY